MLLTEKCEIINNRDDEYEALVCSNCGYGFGWKIYNSYFKKTRYESEDNIENFKFCPYCGERL